MKAERMLESPDVGGFLPKDSMTHLHKKRKRIIKHLLITVSAILVLLTGFILWFNISLGPVDASSKETKLIKISSGMSYSEIEDLLDENKLIKNRIAFDLYLWLNGYANKLKAGSYSLSQSESSQSIVSKLLSGKSTSVSVKFLPGNTLAKHKEALLGYGYSENEVNEALGAEYTGAILEGRPNDADLEGYIYGQTYFMPADASAKEILQRAIDELSSVSTANNLKSKFASQDLSLFEGITLASIVQRELNGDGSNTPTEDQKIVAGIFLNRLRIGMTLGSDVTYQYIADKLGIDRSPNINNPYNTRRFPGLPPGPISSPGLTSLLAVANPADTDYLYFLSGDDDKMYYAKTDAEHQINIEKYCKFKCLIL